MKRARLLVPAAALLLAAGCSTPSGATAFVVDGNKVSNQQVDDATSGCAPMANKPVAEVRPLIATYLAEGKVAQAVTARTGVAVTDAERSAVIEKNGLTKLLDDADCASAINAVAEFSALTMKVPEAKLAAALEAIKVEVNPRYGAWDPRTASLTGTSGSLSREDLGAGQVFGR